MRLISRLIFAGLGLLLFAAQAAAQETRVSAAADADVIAVYSPYVEKRLLRARFDRAAGKLSLVPFGPPGVENFAVAPNAAFTVYSSTQDSITGDGMSYLSLLDEAGRTLGEPLRSPIGAITRLLISPKGDRIAASSDKGWLAVFAITGTGPARRLAVRAEFGVKADRSFSFAFRPDGGLVTMVADWTTTWRSNDGVVQRTLDLKTINRGLDAADAAMDGLFLLNWSPRGDYFTVNWGGGPMFTKIFNAAGHLLQPRGLENGLDWGATNVAYVDGGDAMILYGMQQPALFRLKSLAITPDLGPPGPAVVGCAALGGSHEIALVAGDRIDMWSLGGKRLTAPVGLENYNLHTAVPGAKDEVIVAAARGGWVDLFTKEGKFLRRVQSGAQEVHGSIATSADGATIAALSWGELGVITGLGERTWSAHAPDSGPLVAVAANGSRIAVEGPETTLRTWARDGAEPDVIPLQAAGQRPGKRLSGLAISTNGDAIAAAEEGSAVWLASVTDNRVLRVALAAQRVAPLPDGTGFAVGLADGTVMRLGRDGTVQGPTVKVSEHEPVHYIVVAPDGQSFIAVSEGKARQLTWDGKVLAGPNRSAIVGAFFRGTSPGLIVNYDGPTADFGVSPLTPPGEYQRTPLEPPR